MRIKELRIKENLSQIEMAKKLEISQEKYSRIETQVSKLDSNTLIKIADCFDVSLDYLCDRQWHNQVGYIPEDRRELVKEIIELNDNEIKEVKAFINGFKAGRSSGSDFNVFE